MPGRLLGNEPDDRLSGRACETVVTLTRFDGGQFVPEETHENSLKKVLGELTHAGRPRCAPCE